MFIIGCNHESMMANWDMGTKEEDWEYSQKDYEDEDVEFGHIDLGGEG